MNVQSACSLALTHALRCHWCTAHAWWHGLQ